MKMQRSVIFVKKNSKMNIWKKEEYCKFIDHCYYAGKYRDATLSIFNLEYIVPEKIPIVFHNESKYDYHFIVTELAEKF